MSVSTLGISSAVRVYHTVADVGNAASATLTTLNSFTLGAGVLLRNGDSIEYDYWGIFTGAANTNLLLNLDGDDIFSSGNIDPTGGGWELHGALVRVTATTYRWYGRLVTPGSIIMTVPASDNPMTWANAHTLAVHAVGDAADDIVICGGFITFYGAPS